MSRKTFDEDFKRSTAQNDDGTEQVSRANSHIKDLFVIILIVAASTVLRMIKSPLFFSLPRFRLVTSSFKYRDRSFLYLNDEEINV